MTVNGPADGRQSWWQSAISKHHLGRRSSATRSPREEDPQQIPLQRMARLTPRCSRADRVSIQATQTWRSACCLVARALRRARASGQHQTLKPAHFSLFLFASFFAVWPGPRSRRRRLTLCAEASSLTRTHRWKPTPTVCALARRRPPSCSPPHLPCSHQPPSRSPKPPGPRSPQALNPREPFPGASRIL